MPETTQVNPDHVNSFDDARVAVWTFLTPDWPTLELGVLQIAPWGWESDRFWGVTVTNDVADQVVVLVEKDTGAMWEPNWRDWIFGGIQDGMTRVGDWTGQE